MAIHPDIRDQAYQFFTEEATGLLHLIESGLLTLNQERSTAKIHSLMRSAHSLKGGAAGVGLEAIATLAHRLENIFKALYNEQLATDPTVESWLLQAYDCLRLPLSEQITTGSFDAEQALAAAEPIFSQIEAYCGDALTQADSYIPSSDDMGVDMVVSIFEIDVAQGLEQLAMAIVQTGSDLVGELQLQSEVFAGFAELLNLPNFGAIAQTVQQALARYPDHAMEIAQLALSEFKQSRTAVLSGDRMGGAPPSMALLSFTSSEMRPLTKLELPANPTDQVTDAQDLSEVAELQTPSEFLEYEVDQLDLAQIETDLAAASSISETDLELYRVDFELPDLDSLSVEDLDLPEISLAIETTETTETPIERSSESTPTYFETDPASPANIHQDFLNQDSLNQNIPIPSPPVPLHNIEPGMQSRFSWQSPQSNHSPTTAGLTVRVDADRLERMNNLVGELSINRSSLSLQNDQLQRVLRELRQRFARFQSLVTKLQTLPEQMVTPEREWAMTTHRLHSNGASNRLPFDRATYPSAIEFDALEMDHYGAAYSNLQEILEDLVQLEESVDDIALFTRQSNQALEQQQHKLTQLRDELVWARMLPLSEVLNRFPRILRDLSVTYQKPVNLKITGAELLIDRAILEKLYDPLLHLLRNAFDHGIESPHLRQQQAKPAQGQIEIRALHQGNQTVIELRDDGQGIDLDRIRTRACELGWFSAEQVASLSTSQLIELIFEPSFSTATQVSELSGRGFGLDVVRSDLKAIRGKVSVVSVPGEGTTFTLALPLTLTITQLIICLVGPLPIALPADSIADILTPDQSSIERQTDQLQWRDQMIPVYSFADLLNYACPTPKTVANQILAAFPAPKDWAAPIVVIQREQQFFGLAVERIITEQELVIKPFGAALASPNYLYGCTILGDGSAVPVVDAVALLAISQQPANTISGSDTSSSGRSEAAVPTGVPTAIQMAQAPTILVVDDAITLRRTLALFLEREGFRVLQAQDGQEAMDQLQQAAVQLIVCDIEMPNMNGFEFLNARRQDSQLVQIPVVMLTSRSNEKHRWLALKLGANAYFTKPYLEQEFLSALKTLVTPVVV